MRIKILWTFLLGLIFAFQAHGQSWRKSPFEIYAGFGTAHYFGDIGGSDSENTWYGIKDLDVFRSRPGILTGIRYFQSDYLGISGSLALGWLSGSDEGGPNEGRVYVLNTVVLEPAARIEFFPVRDLMVLSGVNRRGMVRNYGTFSAYIFGGAGAAVYHVRPNANLEARQERDNIDHGFVTMVIPAGLGIKVGISNTMDIGLELGGRYALNDYLDGFTSPTATANDIYYLTTVQFIYRLEDLGL